MKSSTIQTIYRIYAILLLIFIFQELFPVLFILPTTPRNYLIALNFPLTTGIMLILIPFFTAKNYIKNSEQEYMLSWLIRRYIIVLIVSALSAYFLPYVTYEGIVTDYGFRYFIYSGLFGLILILFGYFQLSINRLYFGFLIGTAGSTMGFSNHIKILIYVLLQYNTRFEIGFFIGFLTWFIILLINLIYLIKTNSLNHFQ